MSYNLNLTFGYKDTDFSRDYAFEVDDSVSSADIVTAVKAINSSLSGGTSGGLDEFFIADNGEKFNRILKAETNSADSTLIYPQGGE